MVNCQGMIKYVLNSGNAKRFPEKLKKYNEEVFKDFVVGGDKEILEGKSVKVLMCIFAQQREFWEAKFEIYRKNVGVGVDVEVETRLAVPDKFVKQCQWADVIIIAGGDDELLEYRFSKFDIPNIWKDKIVATGSASSNYLSSSFWTCDWRTNMDGQGILPIKFIPHFKSDFGDDDPRGPIDWDSAYKELEAYGDRSLPIHALEEGDFVVFSV